MKMLIKSHNHDHFWIESGELYESYRTLRGIRYRLIGYVKFPDTDRLTEADAEKIQTLNLWRSEMKKEDNV